MTKMLSKIGGLFTPHHVKTRFSKQRCRDASKYLLQRKPRVLIWGAGFTLLLFLCAIPYATAGTVSYTYDNAGRLIRADFGDGKVIDYTYDKAGNLLERRVGGSTGVFSDVPSGYWAENYIIAIYNAGITTGCAQDDPSTPENERKYCPEDLVSRDQMAAFLVRAIEGEPAADYCSTGSPFSDVDANHWACKYIKRLYELGITTGCGQNPLIYCPNDIVTRAQMAVFLARAFLGME